MTEDNEDPELPRWTFGNSLQRENALVSAAWVVVPLAILIALRAAFWPS